MENEQRPRLSYQECDDLVRAYRDHNDMEAAEALLKAFEGYIVKFYNVIRLGKILIHDQSLREFVKLYMKNEYARKHIHQYKRMPLVQQEIYGVVESIRQLCASYSDEELLHEIYLALLTMAKRYQSRDEKPRFHTYILQAFHYQLRRQLQGLVADPILFKSAINVNYSDEYYSDFDDSNAIDVGNFEDTRKTFTIEESFDEINDNWILGLTTSDEYRVLTTMERKIIKLYYVDDLSDQEIANMLGTCRATVNRRRNKAVKTLERGYREQKRLDD